jgi:glutathione S-transferase kappa 1
MLKVDFYFDVMSPYTYIAWKILVNYRSVWNLDVIFKPFALGMIMKGSGNTPPGLVPSKANWMFQDISRTVNVMNLSHFIPPPSNFFTHFGKVCLSVNRMLCDAIPKLDKEGRWALVDFAFSLMWEDRSLRNDKNEFIGNEEAVAARLSPDGRFSSQRGRAVLIANSAQALERKAFGSPTFYFPDTDEIFFGSDRFEQMAAIHGLKWEGPNGINRSRL